MKNHMMWCTACEYNQEYYFSRVKQWYNQVKQFEEDTDFYVIVDGTLVINDIPIQKNINYIFLNPALGRESCWCFPGWKRSFGKALELSINYEYVSHMESDFVLFNMDKFKEFRDKKGSFCSYDIKYKFIEPSLMILNDIKIKETLYKKYKERVNWYENIDFEEWLTNSNMLNPMFTSYRQEGETLSNDILNRVDGIAQYNGANSDKSK